MVFLLSAVIMVVTWSYTVFVAWQKAPKVYESNSHDQTSTTSKQPKPYANGAAVIQPNVTTDITKPNPQPNQDKPENKRGWPWPIRSEWVMVVLTGIYVIFS